MPILVVLILCLVVWLLAVMAQYLCSPAMPTGVKVFQLRSNSTMADVLTYRVSAAAPVDADVVSRLLTLVVNGEDQGTAELSAASTDLSVFSVEQNDVVELRLVDVDDAGNKSEPATLTFTAVDTIAPAQPGSFGVTLVSETQSDEPTA